MRSTPTSPAIALLVAAAIAGCGGDDSGSSERADPPAKPPRGWHTVTNEKAGLTIAAPRRWTAETKREATLIRSEDRLVVVTVVADRSEAGRKTSPPDYARQTIESLPDFEGSISPTPRRIQGPPYRNARLDGVGQVATAPRSQRIAVAAYHRPDQVTYTAVVFRNVSVDPRVHERTISRILASFRARPPED
jgi:hypothetical protein